MSSDLDKEKQRKLAEEARRREEEELREQVRKKYEEAAERARKASEEGQEIARRAAEEGAKLGEEQARRAYSDAQRKREDLQRKDEPVEPKKSLVEPKKEPVLTPTYLQLPGAGSATQGRDPVPSRDPTPSSDLPLTSIASPPPPVYYIIIGRGAAAIMNHTTLRQTTFGKDRIGRRAVLHIGFTNPWLKYMRHGMGQPPYLLSLPGYEQRPGSDAATVDGGMDSRVFAGYTAHEFQRLQEKYGAKAPDPLAAWVVMVQRDGDNKLPEALENALKGDGLSEDFLGKIKDKLKEPFRAAEPCKYRVLVMEPKKTPALEDLSFYYASHVDICTGPGRPIVDPIAASAAEDTAVIQAARTKPWLPVEKWDEALKSRKVMTAVDAIYDESVWTAGERVCITAGGGVGLNAAEKSVNNNLWSDWFGRTTLHAATFANPRNDTILKHPGTPKGSGLKMTPGQLGDRAAGLLIPAFDRMRIGGGTVLESVVAADTLVITLKQYVALRAPAAPTSWIIDADEESTALASGYFLSSIPYKVKYDPSPSKNYDRLVIPNGQDAKGLGHPFLFAHHLTLTPLTVTGGLMVALHTGDDLVRVLGAAAQVYPNLGLGGTDANSKTLNDSLKELPLSAVPDGFIFSGFNIARANQYFHGGNSSTNVNTASQSEIQDALKATFPGNAEVIAKAIVTARKRPNNGLASMEAVLDKLKAGETTKEIVGLETVSTLLSVAYPPSDASKLMDAEV